MGCIFRTTRPMVVREALMPRLSKERQVASPAGGLYRKALTFHRLTLSRETADVVQATEGNGEGISAEERAQIASQLEGKLAQNRIQISSQALAYTAKRRGALLPVISNVAVFAVFIIVGLVIFRLLNHQEQFIARGQATVQGAENKLIAAMKKETEQELRARDQAILDAQTKLQALSQERQHLRGQTDLAIKAREQELQADFEAKLAQEKASLQEQGLSAEAESQRLKEFQAARQREVDRQLSQARRQAEAELAARQKSMAVLAAQYQSDLDAARQQRSQIQNDYAQKEAGLRSQYAQGLQAAESARAAVSQELARLRDQREKEQLVLDQILAGYTRVNAALQKQDLTEAQKSLDSLRAYLDDPTVADLPTIQKRRAVELFLIDSLGDLVRSRRSAATAATAVTAEANAQLRSVSDLVERGDALSKAGNLTAAREAYLQALRVIAPVNRGYLALEELRAAEDLRASQAAVTGLQKGNLFYQAGNFLGSLQQYRQAVGLLLKDEALANQLTDNVMNAGYRVLAADDLAALATLRTDAEKRQAILKRLQEIRSQYLAYAALPPQSSPGDAAGNQSLASLLQAKILLRQIVDSDPVRSKYPQLGSDIERYFVALEQQGRTEGRQAAIDEMASVLDRLAGSSSSPQTAATADSAKGDPLVGILDRLQRLLGAK
jgi:hypothetical protein